MILERLVLRIYCRNQITELFLNPSISIEAVYVVSPPIFNNQNSWKLDQLNRSLNLIKLISPSHNL